MAVARMCSKLRARVVSDFRQFYVVQGSRTLARFAKYSPAKTFAKRYNSMFVWLGQSSGVFVTDFVAAVTDTLQIAGSGDGRYKPPLTLE